MINQKVRAAVLALNDKNHGIRAIARMLSISRNAVRDILRRGSQQVPAIERQQLGDRWRDEILAHYIPCKGNLVRVHEELAKMGANLSYQALTAFCRRHEIGYTPPLPAGRYHFKPGQEMQHDTSPHQARIGGTWRKIQTASLVPCYSRRIFFQCYPRFTRFECKIFLNDGIVYFGGACETCMIDNTHVVVLKGSGAAMTVVPEMGAFAERYGFAFKAHEIGDANRSARVEGPFNWIDNNFLAGREFHDFRHLNQEALAWCDQKNASFSRKLRGSRNERFAVEAPCLRPLPTWIPEVYLLHHRIVDVEGYVSVQTNRYSAPWKLIGRQMEVRETKERVEIFDGPRLVASHERVLDGHDMWVTELAHRPPRGQGRLRNAPSPEEQAICQAEPRLTGYVAALKKHASGKGTLALRRLLRLLNEYPRGPVVSAIQCAEHYGLFDQDRLERLILKRVAADYFSIKDPEINNE